MVALGGVCTLCALPEERGQPTLLWAPSNCLVGARASCLHKAALRVHTAFGHFRHSLMGVGRGEYSQWHRRPFYIGEKFFFGWADSSSHSALVKKIDFDNATGTYPKCRPNCSFLLQRSDAATLNESASVMILLQTNHSSPFLGGTRYFVMEHRFDTCNPAKVRSSNVLLVHSTDVWPQRGARSGGNFGSATRAKSSARWTTSYVYGSTVLVDCTPCTAKWEDAGCSLGSSIELDTGNEAASMGVKVSVHSELESRMLKVTLSPLRGPPSPQC